MDTQHPGLIQETAHEMSLPHVVQRVSMKEVGNAVRRTIYRAYGIVPGREHVAETDPLRAQAASIMSSVAQAAILHTIAGTADVVSAAAKEAKRTTGQA